MTYIILCDYYSMIWRQYKQCNTDVTQIIKSSGKFRLLVETFSSKVSVSYRAKNVLATAVIEKERTTWSALSVFA